jgi:hypothetical protein
LRFSAVEAWAQIPTVTCRSLCPAISRTTCGGTPRPQDEGGRPRVPVICARGQGRSCGGLHVDMGLLVMHLDRACVYRPGDLPQMGQISAIASVYATVFRVHGFAVDRYREP